MEIKKYEWIYKFESGQIEIIPDKRNRKTEPNTLFKYYSLNKNSVDAFTNNYIYASHPDQLNDPFDCYYKLINFDDTNSIYQILKGVLDSVEIKKQLDVDRDSFVRQVNYNYFHRAISDLGILSLTSEPYNVLMWTHYSNNNGFVIEYDLKELIRNNVSSEFRTGPFQINYQKRILPVSFNLNEIGLIFLYLTNIKAKKWKYENEWRMIFGRKRMFTPNIDIPDPGGLLKNSRKFKIENKAVKKIIIGKKFFNQKEIRKFDNVHSIVFANLPNNKNVFYKKALLKYIVQNNVPSELIGLDSKTFSLKPLNIEFQKTENENEYTFLIREC